MKITPKSISSGTVEVMGVDLVVHQLDNGQRVIESESVEAFFKALESGREMTPDEADKLARLLG